jgi:hypothetical protein
LAHEGIRFEVEAAYCARVYRCGFLRHTAFMAFTMVA